MIDEYHTPVLVDAVLRYLQPRPGGIYVDGTLGGGGHSEQILMNSSPTSRVIGFDMDPDAIAFARNRLKQFGERVEFIRDNVANLRKRLSELSIARLDGLLLDLGISSHQIGSEGRGFSFQESGRLDMRMDPASGIDAWSVVNTYDESRLSEILWKFGEERSSRRIARRIIDRRKQGPVDTTLDLTGIVESVVGAKYLPQSLARVFQAIRIEVNGELENLKASLESAMEFVTPGGRIVVISYHSLEDRTVKEFFKEESKEFTKSGTKLLPDRPAKPRLKVLTKKPVVPSAAEIAENARSRSAKLRSAERL